MIDKFATRAEDITGPANSGFTITPNDATELPEITRAIYIGNGGNLSVEMNKGGTLEFVNVPSGSLMPIRAKKVLEATTATSLIGIH